MRAIVDALRSPAVNLPALAKRVEAAHFPDPTSTSDVVPETTNMTPLSYDSRSYSAPLISNSVTNTTIGTSVGMIKTKSASSLVRLLLLFSLLCYNSYFSSCRHKGQ